MLKKIIKLFSEKEKFFLTYLIIFSVFVAIIETVAVVVIMPFISVATDFNKISENKYFSLFYNFFGFSNEINFVLAFGVGLIFFYSFRGIINLLYFYLLSKFSKGMTHNLSLMLFQHYMNLPYQQFISRNSSELTKIIINETQYLTVMISAVLLMISEVFIVLLIYSIMLYINWETTIIITIFLLVNFIFVVRIISQKVKFQGTSRESFQRQFHEIINSSFGNYKMIKLQSNDRILLNCFKESSYGFARANIISEVLFHIPRLLLETIGFVLVSMIVVLLIYINNENISNHLGILSMFILGLYRLMPSANRIINGYHHVQFNHKAFELIYNDLLNNGENLGYEEISFKKRIYLRNIDFEYSKNKKVVENIDLLIEKGEKIAFIGASGSGKSTLVDIIIGLYKPTNGQMVVDDIRVDESNVRSWRNKVGYIPQSVYLFDGTVADNVSFGLEYNEERIKNVLSTAKILEFLEIYQNGIDTFVGEGGVKLSGGQKQRIAIARALYREPEILVLDEATSALDEAIEKEIMDEIYNLSQDKTLIIIAHRLSTIKNCNKIYTIENKKVRLIK
ncbi:MAG: ABC transporter ATP-binding protein [Arcobacteraceae bacterium]